MVFFEMSLGYFFRRAKALEDIEPMNNWSSHKPVATFISSGFSSSRSSSGILLNSSSLRTKPNQKVNLRAQSPDCLEVYK